MRIWRIRGGLFHAVRSPAWAEYFLSSLRGLVPRFADSHTASAVGLILSPRRGWAGGAALAYLLADEAGWVPA
jgi:hypothetical protein